MYFTFINYVHSVRFSIYLPLPDWFFISAVVVTSIKHLSSCTRLFPDSIETNRERLRTQIITFEVSKLKWNERKKNIIMKKKGNWIYLLFMYTTHNDKQLAQNERLWRWWWWLIVFWPTNRITVKLNPVQYAIFELFLSYTFLRSEVIDDVVPCAFLFFPTSVFFSSFFIMSLSSVDLAWPLPSEPYECLWTSVITPVASNLYRVQIVNLRDRWHQWYQTVYRIV